ncbi:unnamed protein product [Anisakis simplex]|uniref:Ovule protein n=1 Tax=Anisakis simplex TaxID=6269 RepID=A0A0M3JQS1_ANISI|nr:unnamed protein product [Anisakis simplex]
MAPNNRENVVVGSAARSANRFSKDSNYDKNRHNSSQSQNSDWWSYSSNANASSTTGAFIYSDSVKELDEQLAKVRQSPSKVN